MASRIDSADGTRGPSDARSRTGCAKTGSCLEAAGDLAPVYQEEGDQGQGGPSRSKRDMEFVRETMLTAQVQNVIVRIKMVGQELILIAIGDGAQWLRRSMRVQVCPCLGNGVAEHCKWPQTVKSEVASRVNEIAKLPLEFATKRRMQMAPTTWAEECSAHMQWARRLIEMIHPVRTTEDWSLMDCQEYFVDLETSLTGVATALEVSGPGQLRDDQMGSTENWSRRWVLPAALRTSSERSIWKITTSWEFL
jgi:hypothetical protein